MVDSSRMDDFLRAALTQLSPGEALLLVDTVLELPRETRAPDSRAEGALKFGVAEAALWLTPILLTVGKWLLDASQEPLKARVKSYVAQLIGDKSASKPKSDPSSPLTTLGDKFEATCLQAGFDGAEARNLRLRFVAFCAENPALLKKAVE